MSHEETELTSAQKLTKELNVAVDAAIGIIAIRVPPAEVFRAVDVIYAFAASQDAPFKTWAIDTGWADFEMPGKDVLGDRVDNTADHNSTVGAFPQETDEAEDEFDDEEDSEEEVEFQFDPFKFAKNDKTTNSISAAFDEMWNNQTFGDRAYCVMLDAHYYLDDPDFRSSIRNQAHRALQNEQRLFIIVPENMPIPDSIADMLHIVDFSPPGRDELERAFHDIFAQVTKAIRPKWTEDEVRAVVNNGIGLDKSAFDTALSIALTSWSNLHGSAKGITIDHVLSSLREYKMGVLRKTHVLELLTPIPMSEVGGLENYKEWIKTRRKSFTKKAREFGITPSRGCVVVGPPGTGKSLLAKATCSAEALNLPGLRFDVSRVFNAYIGNSEQAMRGALKVIDEMAPVVVFMDEIDKGFAGMAGGSGSDNGTSSRVFGTFLTWMQERDQMNRPVFMILTANRLEGLPPEMLRRGRVDEIWAVLMPNRTEREETIRIHLAKRGHEDELSDEELAKFVTLTENLVGAEIESLIESALNRDFTADHATITMESIETERHFLKPMSQTFGAELSKMQTWADTNARHASVKEGERADAAVFRPKAKRPLRRLKTERAKHDA